MRDRVIRGWSGLLCVLLVTVVARQVEAKEGFGRFDRDVAKLVRVQPPAVFLMETRIDVRATGANSDLTALAQRLESQLEAELVERDSRLTIDSRDPAIAVDIKVLQNVGEEHWENRKMQQQRKVGTDSNGKARYDWVEVTVPYKVVTHRFEAAYTVIDLVKKGSLDANTVQFPFKGEFAEGRGAPELFTLESSALANIAERIALRITPSREVVGVLLPKGSLDDLSKLAKAGQWNRFLEGLEQLPKRPAAVDESYRLYALGTAYEALGYEADDPEVTLRYLQEADLRYSQAIEANPGEKFFIKPYDSFLTKKSAEAPLQRVRDALASYRRLKDFRDSYESLQLAAVEEAKSIEEGSAAGMDNAAVIRMVKAGLGDDIILTAVNTAPDVGFDVSPSGLIALAEAAVPKPIIARLQEIAAGPGDRDRKDKSSTKPKKD